MVKKSVLFLSVLSFFALAAEAQENSSAPAASGQNVTAGTAAPAAENASAAQTAAAAVAASTATANGEAAPGGSAEEAKPEKPKNKSYYAPERNHNPMMSPRDYDNLRKAEQARIDAEREAKLAAEMAAKMQNAGYEYDPEAKVPKKKVDPMAILNKKLRLQGIMGDMVIINNDTYGRGDIINKTGGARVKTIGGNYIIIEYKGKTLKKVMKN